MRFFFLALSLFLFLGIELNYSGLVSGVNEGEEDFEVGIDWITALDSPLNEQECPPEGTSPKDINPGVDLHLILPDTPYIHRKRINIDDCEYQEQCVLAPGIRRLLRFSTRVENHGTQPFELGSPTDGCFKHLYDCVGNCHNHCHLKDFADYYVMDGNNTCAAAGGKATFCIVDRCDYNRCSYQGLKNHRDNRGNLITQNQRCGDTYTATLDCQYVDISCICPGTYTLQVKLRCGPNWELEQPEYCDGTAQTGSVVEKIVTIQRDGYHPNPENCDGYQNIYGWKGGEDGSCTTIGGE